MLVGALGMASEATPTVELEQNQNKKIIKTIMPLVFEDDSNLSARHILCSELAIQHRGQHVPA